MTPIPLSLLRACMASGELGKRWIRLRNSRIAGILLIESHQCHSLVQMRDGNLVAVGILLEDAVVGFDGGGVTASAIVDLGLVVVGVAGERIVRIVLDDVAELGGRKGVLRSHVVAECRLVELIGGRTEHAGARSRCRRCSSGTVSGGFTFSDDGSRRAAEPRVAGSWEQLLEVDLTRRRPAGLLCMLALIDCCWLCTSCISFWSDPRRALISSTESLRDWIWPETWSTFPLCASCWACICFCSPSRTDCHLVDGVGALLDEILHDAHALVVRLLEASDRVLKLLNLRLQLHHVLVDGKRGRSTEDNGGEQDRGGATKPDESGLRGWILDG